MSRKTHPGLDASKSNQGDEKGNSEGTLTTESHLNTGDSGCPVSLNDSGSPSMKTGGGNTIFVERRPIDILCGRGIPIQTHPGNIRLHAIVNSVRRRYQQAPRQDKTLIIKEIVQQVKAGGARFLKRADADPTGGSTAAKLESVQWEEVGDDFAYQKVSHALRNQKYRSERKAKDDQHQNGPEAGVSSGGNTFLLPSLGAPHPQAQPVSNSHMPFDGAAASQAMPQGNPSFHPGVQNPSTSDAAPSEASATTNTKTALPFLLQLLGAQAPLPQQQVTQPPLNVLLGSLMQQQPSSQPPMPNVPTHNDTGNAAVQQTLLSLLLSNQQQQQQQPAPISNHLQSLNLQLLLSNQELLSGQNQQHHQQNQQPAPSQPIQGFSLGGAGGGQLQYAPALAATTNPLALLLGHLNMTNNAPAPSDTVAMNKHQTYDGQGQYNMSSSYASGNLPPSPSALASLSHSNTSRGHTSNPAPTLANFQGQGATTSANSMHGNQSALLTTLLSSLGQQHQQPSHMQIQQMQQQLQQQQQMQQQNQASLAVGGNTNPGVMALLQQLISANKMHIPGALSTKEATSQQPATGRTSRTNNTTTTGVSEV